MLLRNILVGMLAVTMVSPVWGGGEALGKVVSSNASTVRNTKLTAGSIVFSGDQISVGARGETRIALAGGAQAEALGRSQVRLTKVGGRIRIVVNRGPVSFHSSDGNDIEAIVADVRIRPTEGHETTAIVQALSERHVVIAAQRGTLLVTTANDGKTYTVRPGIAADLSAESNDRKDSNAAHARKVVPAVATSGKGTVWTVVLGGGGIAIAGYMLGRKEMMQTATTAGNEDSPTGPK